MNFTNKKMFNSADQILLYNLPSTQETEVILYFEAQITSLNPVILCKLGEQQTMIQLMCNSSGQVLFGIGSSLTSLGYTFQPNHWNQIVIIYSYFNSKMTICVNGNSFREGFIIQSFFSRSFVFILGSSGSTGRIFEYEQILTLIFIQFILPLQSNIRIYMGSFVIETSTCKLQVGRIQHYCLICQPSYLLSYQDNMTCIFNSGIPHSRDNIMDWNRPANFPPDQIRNLPNPLCRCRKQHFFNKISCQLCPEYCNECEIQGEEIQCIQQDPHRGVFGKCLQGFFDEGYSCLITTYQIIYQINIYKIIPIVGKSSQFLFKLHQYELNWEVETSFFLGFYAKIQLASSDFDEVICYIREGIEDVFVITVSYSTFFKCYNVHLYYKNTKISSFVVNPELLWIGVWNDFSNILFLAGSNGQVLYDKNFIQNLTPFLDPVVCIGTCLLLNETNSIYQGQLPLGLTFIRSKFQFIKISKKNKDLKQNKSQPKNNYYKCFQKLFSKQIFLEMTNSYDRIQDLFFLKEDPGVCIALFQSMNNFLLSDFILQNQIVSYLPSVTLTLACNQMTTHIAKGLLFSSLINSYTELSDILFGKEISVSFTISYFTSKLYVQLLTYVMDGYTFIIQSKYQDSTQRSYIMVCINLISCKQTKQAYIQLNVFSFVGIIFKRQTPSSPDKIIYEFEILVDFKRERINFLIPIINLTYQKTSIQFLQNTDVYLNNIRIFLNSDFYFDYSTTSNCYLSYNIANLYCLKAKVGYVTHLGKSVLPSQCITFSSPFRAVVYNSFTQECLQLSYTIIRCQVYNEDFSICLQCTDQFARQEDCLSCLPGYFMSKVSNLCEECQRQCKTCSTYERCNQCADLKSSLPNCDQNLVCLAKCQTCQGTQDYCLTCSDKRVTPPECGCDPKSYILQRSICIDISCLDKCESCEYSSENCIQCKQGRENPPKCECINNFFDAGSDCKECPSHTFYSSALFKCMECDQYCQQCSQKSSFCTECNDSLILVDNTCLCKNFSPFKISTSGNINCYLNMEASFKITFTNQKYTLTFLFDEELDFIDFDLNPIIDLLHVYIFSIPEQSYTLVNPLIRKNILTVDLQFTGSISLRQGIATFLNTQVFKNSQKNQALYYKYAFTPFLFNIGPFIVEDDANIILKYALDVLNAIKDQNSTFMNILKQLSLIFYILNTLQPCISFLMIKIVIPQNLYSFLQMICLLQFTKVVDYGAEMQTESMSIFGISLSQGQEYDLNSSDLLKRFYLSNCMLINIPITILQTILLCFLFFQLKMIQRTQLKYNSSQKVNMKAIHIQKQKDSPSTIQKITTLILKLIHSHCEASILILSISIFNQLFNLNQSQYLNRLSLYFAILILVLLLSINYYTYANLDIQVISKKGGFSDANLYLALVEKLDFKNRPKAVRIYFFIQLIRKYLLSLFLVLLENYPSLLCGSCSAMFFLSMIVTIWIRPYKSKVGNFAKIGGEACLSSVWMVYLIKFIPFQANVQLLGMISKQDVDSFSKVGFISILIICTFNAIYLMEWIWNKLAVTKRKGN